MKRLVSIITGNWPVLLIFFLQIPLILPFFHRGFFPSHDNVQVVRVFEMYQSLKYGDIPPRWSANLLFGYGYPLYTFYSSLPYLIGSLFAFAGLNFLLSTKIVFIASFFMGSFGVYLLVKQWWGKLPALATAAAYSLTPYRAADVYVRGNLAEFFSFSLFPLVFWLNWKFLSASGQIKKKWGLLLCLALFLLEISHNVSCFIFFIFLFLLNGFYLFVIQKKHYGKTIMDLFKIFGLSLLLSAYYFIPLIFESRFVLLGKFADSPYTNHFLTIKNIWNSQWGWGGFTDPGNAISLRFGKSLIIISIITLVLNIFTKHADKKLFRFLFFCFCLFFFFELKVSGFLWEKITLLHFMQFPWRFHILTTLFLAIFSGGLIFLIQNKFYNKKIENWKVCLITLSLVLILLFENVNLFKPQYYSNAPAASETTTWDDEYLPKWVKIKPKDYSGEKVKFIEGKGKILSEKWGYLTKSFRAEVESQKAVVQIAHVYYPGWQVYVNNKKEEIMYDNDLGAMGVLLLQRDSEVVFKFERTNWRFASDVISIVGLVIFGYLLISSWPRKKSVR